MPLGWSMPSCCPTRRARTAARFLVRALRWFRSQGITVHRLLTDNGSAYCSRALRRVARRLELGHSRARPYRPQTNGKCERWIRTVLSECLYLEVFGSSAERRLALSASSCTTTRCALTWASAVRLLVSASTPSWPAEVVTNVSGDNI
jgi:transposase InsO family protein